MALAQISDPHICDAQSPLRASYFDRLSDPHHPISSMLPGPLGGYRAQEALTTQVFESMLRTLNRMQVAPISGRPLELVLLTGDLADNMQQNELNWVSKLLSGGQVKPTSGSSTNWEGPGSLEHYSPHYWNPEPTPFRQPADSPGTLYEFPKIPGLWTMATREFQSVGLRLPWAAVHGNHDGLIQGTISASQGTREIALRDDLAVAFNSEAAALQFLAQFGPQGPASWPPAKLQEFAKTSPDSARALATSKTWQELSLSPGPSRYWHLDLPNVVILGLDTCNPWGGWDGSIDAEQFDWLRMMLRDHASRRLIVVSHHPHHRLENIWGGPEQEQRISGDLIVAELNKHGNVLAWIAGHTHRHHVTRIADKESLGILSIETASLVDWPQQGRVIEIFESASNELFLASSVINHSGVVSPVAEARQTVELPDYHPEELRVQWLAGLSRQLAANDWQRQGGNYSVANLEGEPLDRDFTIRLQPSNSKK